MEVKRSISQNRKNIVTEHDARNAIKTLLQYIGENPEREGLIDTPQRVVKAWDEMTSGYWQDPECILGRDFEKRGYDGMIIVPRIEFSSVCEHHLMSFWGHVWVGYLPGKHGRVVGLSKIPRLVECFARRLQIQEGMTKDISNAMQSILKPAGVAVRIEAKHSCMCFRGVMKQDASMITTSLTGVFKQHKVREEFLLQCK